MEACIILFIYERKLLTSDVHVYLPAPSTLYLGLLLRNMFYKWCYNKPEADFCVREASWL